MKKGTQRPYSDLRAWREAHGLSQHEAAKRLRISQSVYSRLERRARACYGEKAKRIMEATGVPLEVLVGAA